MRIPQRMPDECAYKVRFRDRMPDPGDCVVMAIDWRRRRLDVTNGVCSYSPSFEEVWVIPELDAKEAY